MIIGKAGQRDMRVKWYADDLDAFAAQEERRSYPRRAKRGGMVACGVVGRWGSYTPDYRAPCSSSNS